MKLVLRTDLGGRAADLPALAPLREIPITKPFVLLAGDNGSGKSSLFAALRQATGLIGPGLGGFPKREGFNVPLAFPSAWSRKETLVDLARHAFWVQDGLKRWEDQDGNPPADGVGVLDPVQLGWAGQRVWLHDGRRADDHSSRFSGDLTSMRRSADDRVRSHGEQMLGRLRYAIAWALGLFDLEDSYDLPARTEEEDHRKREDVPREVFKRLAGHTAGEPGRTTERWLLLDEPETGLSPMAFVRMMSMLLDGAEDGKLKVFCSTHTSLALDLEWHPKVQVIDMDGYLSRLKMARYALERSTECERLAQEERQRLVEDCAKAIRMDRGLVGQGRFTAHEAQSVPYPEAIKAPYGKVECLERMRGMQDGEDVAPGKRR